MADELLNEKGAPWLKNVGEMLLFAVSSGLAIQISTIKCFESPTILTNSLPPFSPETFTHLLYGGKLRNCSNQWHMSTSSLWELLKTPGMVRRYTQIWS